MEASLEERTNTWWTRPAWLALAIDWEKVLYALFFVVAVASRFYNLGARVMSHDESLHTQYSWYLFAGRGFQHSPLMHGPSLFIFTAIDYFLFGDNDFTARVFPAVVGIILAILIPYLLRPWLGRKGALAASAFFLISPSILYHSRYIRHDILLITSAMVMFIGIMYYLTNPKPKHLYWLAAGMALMYVTMEAAYIYTAIFLLFLGLRLLFDLLRLRWGRPELKPAFRMALAAASIATMVAAALVFFGVLGQNLEIRTSTLFIPIAIAAGLAGIAMLAVVVLMHLGVGWSTLRQIPAYNLIALIGTLVLPLLAAFPMKLMGYSMTEVNFTYWTEHWQIILIPVALYVVAATVGVLWDWKHWLIAFGIFYAIFVPLYSTLFTWGPGVLTGIVGGLGYWLEQQGVERGSQPWYYYLWLWPFYEFLVAAVGMVAGFIYLGIKRRGLAEYEKFLLLGALAPVLTVVVSTQFIKPANAMLGLGLIVIALAPLMGALIPGVVRRYRGDEAPPAEIEVEAITVQESLDLAPAVGLGNVPATFLAFTAFWMWASILAYSYAGEKMPWLITHLTAPAVLFTGWVVGRLLDNVDWAGAWKRGGWAVIFFVPVLAMALFRFGEMLLFSPPFRGIESAQLTGTASFIATLLMAVGAVAVLYIYARRLPWGEALRLTAVLAVAFLSVLTIRTAWRFAYINYDYASEYMVYAHGAPETKIVMNEIADMSWKLYGDQSIKVAYDDDVSWPFTWYLRNFPNQTFYGSAPSREQLDAPVVLAGDKNYSKVEPFLTNKYESFEYIFLWWPMQDYFNLTPERLSYVFTQRNAQTGEYEMLHALWDIWFYRDYARYGRVTNQDFSLGKWPVRHSFKLYIRKDVAARFWDKGVQAAAAQPLPPDACDSTRRQVAATLVIQGAGAGLKGPRGMAVAPDGTIYVADTDNNRVAVFSPQGEFLRALETANPALNQPWGVAVDASGNIFVADTWNHRVVKFDPQGQMQAQWGSGALSGGPDASNNGKFWGPRGIAVGADGRVFVTDTGNKRVQIFDQNGLYLGQFGSGGAAEGTMDEPVGIAVDKDGMIYIADTWNTRVDVFDGKSLAYVRNWTVTGWYGQSLDNKPYLAVDSKGHLFITDPEQYRVVGYDLQGKPMACWGQQGNDNASFGLPVGIATDKEGNVYITDATNARVLKFPAP